MSYTSQKPAPLKYKIILLWLANLHPCLWGRMKDTGRKGLQKKGIPWSTPPSFLLSCHPLCVFPVCNYKKRPLQSVGKTRFSYSQGHNFICSFIRYTAEWSWYWHWLPWTNVNCSTEHKSCQVPFGKEFKQGWELLKSKEYSSTQLQMDFRCTGSADTTSTLFLKSWHKHAEKFYMGGPPQRARCACRGH